jgi:hypothetical protein
MQHSDCGGATTLNTASKDMMHGEEGSRRNGQGAGGAEDVLAGLV